MCRLLSKERRAVEITVSIANYTKRRAVRYEYAKKGMTGKDIITVGIFSTVYFVIIIFAFILHSSIAAFTGTPS